MNTFQRIKEEKDLAEKKEKRAQRLQQIALRSKMTKEEILADIRKINEKDIYKVNQVIYDKWDLFLRDEEELDVLLHLFVQRRAMKDTLDCKLKAIDTDAFICDTFDEEIEACRALHKKMISDSMVEKYAPRLIAVKEELADDFALQRETLVDMETTFFLYGYTYEEYIAFCFMDKSLKERLSFLSSAERRKVLSCINDEEASNLFHDKHACYLKFQKYFRREQICVCSNNDFAEFRKFCGKVPVFVKKPLVAQKGKGVAPIYIDDTTDLKALMEMLLNENGPFVAEEMIKTHESINALNPDSVNTVRVETFFDGRTATIANAFLRVGKAGHFVDNGSAGGIIVPIDLEKGTLTAIGKDKTNVVYKAHPDTGIIFDGYEIPKWKSLVKLTKKLASMYPAVKYVGWDMTLNKRGKWVVVEGNAKPGGLGVQRSSGKGTRADFFQVIQKTPNDFR